MIRIIRRRLPIFFGLLALWIWSGPVRAETTACPGHFFGGVPPEVTRDVGVIRALCFQAFAVLHSGRYRTPTYAAEHLTDAVLRRRPGRDCPFHSESKLPFDEAARLSDYLGSGYDRGHMAPDRDMPSGAAEHESCSLANVVPQDHGLNIGAWKELEKQVREMALDNGDLYVVTGPLYDGLLVRRVGRIAIPDFVWKAVLDPKSRQTLAAIAANDDTDEVRVLSLEELEARIGIKIFPALGTNDDDGG